ncbi:hypothetical protein PE067_09360 [Paracoccus sp. DMF-8]|uniref:hypothetical protein n=1 Tax=Paracoccus sp. DMF-8 TaxID=3019445 RepID=UPI0023E857E6|nr:hypothetical protein [Paracoccus sp. DMF-8]MDF3606326.1 hypothetical protein [Paracoccus sp. DMF-8]
MIDPQKFGAELAGIVKAATAPILSRIEAMERRIEALPVPRDGKDADAAAIAALVRAEVKADLDAIKGLILEQPELPDIPALIEVAVDEAVKALPVAKYGEPGASVTVVDVLPALQEQVKAYLDATPVPQDGKDGRDGADGAPGKDGAPGAAGEPGRDGLDVKDLFRADGGRLVAVMSDGTTKDLGVFVGSDGADGAPGQDGKDGSDGLGFEDLDFVTDDHGRVTARFQRGDLVKSVRLPGIVDRGPFKAGEAYEKGDAVSYGGSLWIAQAGTSAKPDGGDGWRLAVKKGRDGRGA